MNNPDTYGRVPTIDRDETADNAPASPAPQAAQIDIDDSKSTANYANFCRLSGTPEELIIEFGLNTQTTGDATQPVTMTRRIVTGWHTAKRLLQILQLTVERHEGAFGVVETDVQKRVQRT